MGLRDLIVGKFAEQMFNLLTDYIDEHWDEIVAKGKDYLDQLIQIARDKLLGVETFAADGDDELLTGFREAVDELANSQEG